MPRIHHSGRCWQADTVWLVSALIGHYVTSRLARRIVITVHSILCKGRIGCRLGLLLLLVMLHCSELDYSFRYLIEFQFTGRLQCNSASRHPFLRILTGSAISLVRAQNNIVGKIWTWADEYEVAVKWSCSKNWFQYSSLVLKINASGIDICLNIFDFLLCTEDRCTNISCQMYITKVFQIQFKIIHVLHLQIDKQLVFVTTLRLLSHSVLNREMIIFIHHQVVEKKKEEI